MRKPSHLPAYGPGKHRKQSPPRRTGANTLQARLSVKTLRADRSAVPRAPHEQSRLDPSKPYAIMNVADHEVIFASTDYAAHQPTIFQRWEDATNGSICLRLTAADPLLAF
jgi:hypothetical protein